MRKSKCCKSNMKVGWDTTRYFICEKCNKACDYETKEIPKETL